MAYVNIAEWTPDQVSEWLKGLDDVIVPYLHYFINNNVDGKRLLQLSPDDLPSLNLTKIGHQEIVLQGVELLRNIHYHLHQENVQYLALRLSSKARSIYNELRLITPPTRNGGGSAGEEDEREEEEDGGGRRKKKQERVSTAVLAGVADVLSSVKGVVSWLNRQPFEGVEQYDHLKSDLVDLSIRLATIAQRDMFAENQATVILQSCLRLAQISDKIIQEYSDPLIIQPASLDVATIKKKADDEWGVKLQSSYHGVHQVSGVRALSPAYQCGKMEEGDELIQVNYQTVVGWNTLKVTQIMQECPVEVILTLKKRPRHANSLTQIYFKPFRLPSKKRTYSPWGGSVVTSPRYDLQSIPNLQLSVSVDKVPIRREASRQAVPPTKTPQPVIPPPPPPPLSSLSDQPNTTSDSEPEDSDLEDDPFLSDSDIGGSSPISVRLYQAKPRAPVQRRATIPGATTRPSFSFDQLLQDVRRNIGGRSRFLESSPPSDPELMRPNGGTEHRTARPHTCIGVEKKDSTNKAEHPVKEEKADDDDVAKEEKPEDKDQTLKNNDKKISENKCDDKSVVNVIPLPPRKPTNHSGSSIYTSPQRMPDPPTSGSPQQRPADESSASTTNSPLQQGDLKTTPIKDVPTTGQSVTIPSHTETPPTPSHQSSSTSGQEAAFDASSKHRQVSDDRPKLDKSHSTPAYDIEREVVLSGSPSPTVSSAPCEGSPAIHPTPRRTNTTPARINTSQIKTTLSARLLPSSVSKGDLPLLVAQQVSTNASPDPLTVSATIISSATTTVGSIGCEHYVAQVTFPVAEAKQTTSGILPESVRVDTGVSDGGGCGDGAHQSSDGGSNKSVRDGGCEGNSHTDKEIMNSSNVSVINAENKLSSSLTPPCSSTPSVTTVVLRETRSGSPSVWRRGLLVTDRGSRRISCRDLGQGDHQGWLYRRRDNKGFLLPHRWERRWFILKKNYLYGYRDREAMRADSLIYLPGFHVCPASDVKSKKFAFKIYHSSGATFYFACDSGEERSRWMSQMGLSAISSTNNQQRQHHSTQQQHYHHQYQGSEEAYYSETDDELEERVSPSRRSPQSPQSRVSPSKDSVGSSWRAGSSSPSRGSDSRGMPLASLSSGKGQALRFLQPSRDMSNQPVPTASFRSYRRVSESSTRSTSTGDLRGTVKSDMGSLLETPTGSDASGRRVTRKNSLRDRLRQLPASFTLDRRRQPPVRPGTHQDQQKLSKKVQQQHQEHLSSKQKETATQQQEGEEEKQLVCSTITAYINQNEKEDESSFSSHVPGEQQVSSTDPSASRHRPHYMLPTRASSQHSPVRPSSIDLDTRVSPNRMSNGRWGETPPSSGRCSPSKMEIGNRRGSVGGESPVRSQSPRRGSLDCLASSHPRALSPPVSPLHTPTRSSHGSASSLLASEEYREGSPEKLWINSLRSDTSRPRPVARSSPEKKDSRSRFSSGDSNTPDRLKRTALYHPPLLRGRTDGMKPAFELALDLRSSQTPVDRSSSGFQQLPASTSQTIMTTLVHHIPGEHRELSTTSVVTPRRQHQRETVCSSHIVRIHSTPRPEVPPRTKFLSPSERTLPVCVSLQSSISTLSTCSSTASVNSATKLTSSVPAFTSSLQHRPSTSSVYVSPDSPIPSHARTTRPVTSLTIKTHADESEMQRTPLKPAMGVSMIGKQRRTPGVMSPRDVFFSSPPSSPTTPFSPSVPNLVSPPASSAASFPVVPYPYNLLGKAAKLHNQKILPHYPGMEYPPVFEPGSYSLCGSPSDHSVYQMPSPRSPLLPHHHSAVQQDFPEAQSGYATTTGTMNALYSGEDTGVEEHPSPETYGRGGSAQSGSWQQVALAKGDSLSHRSSLSPSPSSSVSLQNFHVLSPPETRSHQNLYVSVPTGSRSHQNLYVTSPSRQTSNQNIYVSTPSASRSHQNLYVSTPSASQSQNIHTSSTPFSISHQNLYVSSPSGSNTSKSVCVTVPIGSSSHQHAYISTTGGIVGPQRMHEQSERQNAMAACRAEDEAVADLSRMRKSPPKPVASGEIAVSDTISKMRKSPPRPTEPPRLMLPGPPDSPPSDSEDITTSATQTESVA